MESCVSVRRRGNVWKDYMEMFIKEENNCDLNFEGPAVCVCRQEVLQALNEMRT